MNNKILFLGCGNMGSVILNKFIEYKIFSPQQIKVIKPSTNNKIVNIDYYQSPSQLPSDYKFDMVFICIKPQKSEHILNEFSKLKLYHSNTFFISILAGKKISFFNKFFSKKSKIIRSMPNILIKENHGIVPYLASKSVTEKERIFFENIFNKFSLCFSIENENLFHSFTSLFGSGPAYFFLIAEILVDIAVKLKIEENLALKLVKELILGSSMAIKNSVDIQYLRSTVTSPNGTTFFAIERLNKNNSLKKLFRSRNFTGNKNFQKIIIKLTN